MAWNSTNCLQKSKIASFRILVSFPIYKGLQMLKRLLYHGFEGSKRFSKVTVFDRRKTFSIVHSYFSWNNNKYEKTVKFNKKILNLWCNVRYLEMCTAHVIVQSHFFWGRSKLKFLYKRYEFTIATFHQTYLYLIILIAQAPFRFGSSNKHTNF